MEAAIQEATRAVGAPAAALRVCARCVMDTTDPDIRFDGSGVCHHCHEYEERARTRLLQGKDAEAVLGRIVERIRREGRGRDVDCIVGVSGGMDSTYVAFLAKQLGLRPLAVHLDNGWNSELAVSNIQRCLSKLGIDLFTHVIDWEEFRDLQLAFLKASVPDVEVPTDHAINALLLRTAVKMGVRCILNGMNFRTEALSVPSWMYGHVDWRYIRAVYARFGRRPLTTYPRFSLPYLFYATALRRIRLVAVLNYLPYNHAEVRRRLQDELGWRPYDGKHHESVFTKFLQTYILPRKFGIDKRKVHLSSLILSGQSGMTREKALAELAADPAPPEQLQEDREFVCKKFGISEEEFDELMARPPRTHRDFPSNFRRVMRLKQLQLSLRRMGLLWS